MADRMSWVLVLTRTISWILPPFCRRCTPASREGCQGQRQTCPHHFTRIAQIHHDVDQVLGQPLAPQESRGCPLQHRPKRAVGPKPMVASVQRMTHEQTLCDPAQDHEGHNGERECHTVATQAFDQHLGKGLGREERQNQKRCADRDAKPSDEQRPKEATHTKC